MRIVLASGSPRRKELLEQIGFTFEICPAKGEEVVTTNVPEQVVQELSAQKAKEVFEEISGDVLVIGADTVVSFEGRILGKPKDGEDAFLMLKKLNGQEHQVYTGVTLLFRTGTAEERRCFTSCTGVRLYPLSDEEIRAYIATGEPMDKAGAYAVQGIFAKYVEEIHGDFYNVMGLPVARLYHELKQKQKGAIHDREL